jgi:hypothetical protein
MNEWITPDEMKQHFDNGYESGKTHERERIASLKYRLMEWTLLLNQALILILIVRNYLNGDN